jgi:hypothetical protein
MANSNNSTTPLTETSGPGLTQANHEPASATNDATHGQGQEALKLALFMAVDSSTIGMDYIAKHCSPVLRSIVELSDVTNLSAEAIASRMRSIAGIARLGVHLADVAENDMECWIEKAQIELNAFRAAAA